MWTNTRRPGPLTPSGSCSCHLEYSGVSVLPSWEAPPAWPGPTPALTLEVMVGAASVAAQRGSPPAVGMGRRGTSNYRQSGVQAPHSSGQKSVFCHPSLARELGQRRPVPRTPETHLWPDCLCSWAVPSMKTDRQTDSSLRGNGPCPPGSAFASSRPGVSRTLCPWVIFQGPAVPASGLLHLGIIPDAVCHQPHPWAAETWRRGPLGPSWASWP